MTDRSTEGVRSVRYVDETEDAAGPGKPTELQPRSWWGTLGRTLRETKRDNVPDLAAGLTYYAMLSMFPLLLAVLAILGVIGDSATRPLIGNLRELPPGPARDTIITAIENLQRGQSGAGLLLVVSVLGGLWSASRYVAAFMRASNVIYGVEEGRPVWKKVPVRFGVTVLHALALVVSAAAVVLTGGLARQVGDMVGLGSTAVAVWDAAKWPVAVLVVGLLVAVLYWAAPNVRHPGFRWLGPGAVLAVGVWVGGSAAFALYVASFGSFNETYGALGGVISFLVWLWIANVAVLLGAELNAELERSRQIERGIPADEQPFLARRDTAKLGRGP